MYFIIFIPLYFVIQIGKVIKKIEDKKLSRSLSLAHLFLFGTLMLFILARSFIYNIWILFAIIILFTYVVLMVNTFRIAFFPKRIDSEGNTNLIFLASFLIIMFVIMSLVFGVMIIEIAVPNAYSIHLDGMDAAYYTIITFASVGYGDITPCHPVSKIMAIIISLTSISCITILIGSVISTMKELTEFNGKNE